MVVEEMPQWIFAPRLTGSDAKDYFDEAVRYGRCMLLNYPQKGKSRIEGDVSGEV